MPFIPVSSLIFHKRFVINDMQGNCQLVVAEYCYFEITIVREI